ncbi:MAG: hypothetical protein NW208_08980 [Bryobacter sp.]|nr:hypothetical protein [Bryobacter sp.]
MRDFAARHKSKLTLAVSQSKFNISFGFGLEFSIAPWRLVPEDLPPRLILIGEDRPTAEFLRQSATAWGFRSQWIPNPSACWEDLEALVIENDPSTVLLLGATHDVELGEALAASATAREGTRLFVLGEVPDSSCGFIPRPLERFPLYLALSMAGLRPSVDLESSRQHPLRHVHLAACLSYLQGAVLQSLRNSLAMGRNTITLDKTLDEAIGRAARPHALLWPATREGLGAIGRLRRFENDKLLPRLPVFACEEPSSPAQEADFLAAGFDGFLDYPLRVGDVAEAWDILAESPCVPSSAPLPLVSSSSLPLSA